MMRRLTPFLISLALSGCGSSAPTAMVVALSTDLSTPKDLDALEVEVRVGSRTPFYRTYGLPTDAALPGTLTLAASGGKGDPPPGTISPGSVPVEAPSDTVRVVVRGMRGPQTRVTASASFRFVEEETKRLSLPLALACVDISCPDAQTCQAGKCVAELVDATKLPAGP